MLLSFPTKESLLRKLIESKDSDVFLIVANFKSLAGWNLIPLRSLSILLGPNSAGKSTVYDALSVLRQLESRSTERDGEKPLELERHARNVNIAPIVGFSGPYDFHESVTDGRGIISAMLEATQSFLSTDVVQETFQGNFPFLSALVRNESLTNHLLSTRYTVLVNALDRQVDPRLEMTSFVNDVELATWKCEASRQKVFTNGDAMRVLLKDFVSSELTGANYQTEFTSGDYSSSNEQVPTFEMFPAYIYGSSHFISDQDSDEHLEFDDEQSESDHISGLLMTLFNIPITSFLRSVRGGATEDVRILTSDWQFVTPKEWNPYLECQPELSAKNSFTGRGPQSPSGVTLLTHEISAALNQSGAKKYRGKPFLGQSEYLEKINLWLSSTAFLGSKYRLKMQVKECSPLGELDTGNGYLGSGVEYLARLYLTDEIGRPLTFSDVGTGFSQVLPVMIDLAFDRSLLYKQPEVHLHPRLQSKIADCFVERVNTSRDEKVRRVRLIETHSEHFVLRVLRRLKDSFKDELLHSSLTVYPSDFALVYFKPVGDATEVYEIRVSDDGNFIDNWPDGFFDERDEDLWAPIQ